MRKGIRERFLLNMQFVWINANDRPILLMHVLHDIHILTIVNDVIVEFDPLIISEFLLESK